MFLLVYVPEAPKFKYAFRDYHGAREVLREVAERNFLEETEIRRKFDFFFDAEINEVGDLRMSVEQDNGGGEDELSRLMEAQPPPLSMAMRDADSNYSKQYIKPDINDTSFLARWRYIRWHSFN